MVERRRSLQRQRVLEAIKNEGHISAMDIYYRIKPVHPDISIATVYRNIGVLLEERKVCAIGTFNQKEYYDGRTDTHGHYFCIKCGKVYDLELPDIENLLPEAYEVADEIESLQLTCTGVCKACAGSNN